MNNDRLRAALKNVHRKLAQEEWHYGFMGRHNADDTYTYQVRGRRNFVYVTLRLSNGAQTVTPARNDGGVSHSANLPVRMRMENGLYIIDGVARRDDLATVDPPPSSGVPIHEHSALYYQKTEHINVTVGAADAAKPIVTDADGLIDASFLVNAPGASGNALPYKFDVATSGDPGSGHIRLNNATPASAIGINISDLDDNGVDVSTWLSLIGLAANQLSGYLHIWKRSDPTVFHMYAALNAQVDNTTYWTFTIVHLAGNGSFADEDDLWISFVSSGDDGVHGGASATYSWLTATTDSDPGVGSIKANHATFASITQLFIDDSMYPSGDVQEWIATWDDSTSTIKGYLKITNILDQTDWMIFAVTGTTEATGYWKIAVTPVDNNGSFAASDRLVVSFSRTGDKGDTGATGPAGDAADIAAEISGAATDDTIQDADLWGYVTGGVLVKTAFSNIKAVLLTYFSTLFAVLAGVSGGQTLNGGNAANDDLTLQGTSNATRTTSYVHIQPTAGLVQIGPGTGTDRLHIFHSADAGVTVEHDDVGNESPWYSVKKGSNRQFWAMAGAANSFLTGSALGDMVFRGMNGKSILFGIDNGAGTASPGIALTASGLGVGVLAPQAPFHLHDGVRGWMSVSKTAIVGAAQTIIPDATGDVTLGCIVRGIARNTTPGIAKVDTALIAPGGTADVVIGADTLRFAVSAGGALTVVRQAGAATWTFGGTVDWL